MNEVITLNTDSPEIQHLCKVDKRLANRQDILPTSDVVFLQVYEWLYKTKDRSKSSVEKKCKKWKWGSYGWVSPASLIVTAAWRKYFYPNLDCCKIWAKDEINNPIEGGYSIRSEDESITIPIFAKYDLCNGFCSPNSGMQGSRAIEKMRNYKRLNTDFDTAQRTVFDLKLFALILNQINDLNADSALNVFKYLITVAKEIRDKRIKTNVALNQTVSDDFSIINFLSNTADPELTKCVVAACYEVLFTPHGFNLEGVEDYKTAADARAQKPGDLSLSKNGKTIIAIEVKDKTQSIDWNNIDRAKKIINSNPDLENFVFALENRESTVSSSIQDMLHSNQLNSGIADKISFISVHDLLLLAKSVTTESEIATKTGKYLAIVPAIKPETKEAWIKLQ